MRLPEDIDALLTERARRNRRSKNQETIFILESSLKIQTAPDRIRMFPVNGAAATAPPVAAAAVPGQLAFPQEGTASASTTEFAAPQPLFLGETGHSSSTPVA
jgi:hypothetical protein